MAKRKVVLEEQVSNTAKETIEFSLPYIVDITIQGSSDMLFHRWNCEYIDEVARSAKGSKQRKSDNIEAYVYRDHENNICLPGEYLRQSIIHSAKYKQDPRSSRKSAMDLFTAEVLCLTPLASLGTKTWDFDDKRRVVIGRAGINRTRPAMKMGWKADFQLMVNIPEYISTELLYDVLAMAGRLVGVADFRPTYGRFNIVKFEAKSI